MDGKVIRSYKMADDVMLERAQRFKDSVGAELVRFNTCFPWLDAAWLDAFQTDIDTADGYPSDESVTLNQHVLTGDAKSAMKLGYAALIALGHYAQLAFPNDRSRQHVFGQQRWVAARFNPLKLQVALELAYSKANNLEFKDPLLNKGYSQGEIDTLHDLSEELKLKNRVKESAKLGRYVNSRDRVMLLNLVWQHMKTVNVCAKVVWMNDAEHMWQYQLYPSKAVAEEEED